MNETSRVKLSVVEVRNDGVQPRTTTTTKTEEKTIGHRLLLLYHRAACEAISLSLGPHGRRGKGSSPATLGVPRQHNP